MKIKVWGISAGRLPFLGDAAVSIIYYRMFIGYTDNNIQVIRMDSGGYGVGNNSVANGIIKYDGSVELTIDEITG